MRCWDWSGPKRAGTLWRPQRGRAGSREVHVGYARRRIGFRGARLRGACVLVATMAVALAALAPPTSAQPPGGPRILHLPMRWCVLEGSPAARRNPTAAVFERMRRGSSILAREAGITLQSPITTARGGGRIPRHRRSTTQRGPSRATSSCQPSRPSSTASSRSAASRPGGASTGGRAWRRPGRHRSRPHVGHHPRLRDALRCALSGRVGLRLQRQLVGRLLRRRQSHRAQRHWRDAHGRRLLRRPAQRSSWTGASSPMRSGTSCASATATGVDDRGSVGGRIDKFCDDTENPDVSPGSLMSANLRFERVTRLAARPAAHGGLAPPRGRRRPAHHPGAPAEDAELTPPAHQQRRLSRPRSPAAAGRTPLSPLARLRSAGVLGAQVWDALGDAQRSRCRPARGPPGARPLRGRRER